MSFACLQKFGFGWLNMCWVPGTMTFSQNRTFLSRCFQFPNYIRKVCVVCMSAEGAGSEREEFRRVHVCVCVCRCTRYALCSAYAWCVRVMCAHGCTHVCACVVPACREPSDSEQGSLLLDPGSDTGEAATMSASASLMKALLAREL